MEKTIYKSLAGALLASAAMPSAVWAQSANEDEISPENTIVVTAQKRSESLIDVPVAVSVISGADIEAAQVRDLRDLEQLSPSLLVNGTTGSSQQILTIRGIGTAGQNSGLEQSVGVVIDGVARGRIGSAFVDLLDVEQIEILRGPQSTLFGKNTSAGVVSIRTNEPSHDFGGLLSLTYGSDDLVQVRGRLTGPIVEDVLAGSIAAQYQARDGFIEDFVTGQDFNDLDRVTVRGQLLWDISQDVSLRLIGDYAEANESCCAAPYALYGPTAGIIEALGGTLQPNTNGITDPFEREVAVTPGQGYDNSFTDWGISADLQWDFDNVEFNAILAHREFDTTPDVDADFGQLDLLRNFGQTQDIEETSVELRLASTGRQTIDWLMGFYYFDQSIDASNPGFFGSDFRAYADVLSEGNLDILEFVTGTPPGTFFGDGQGDLSTYDYSSESFAFFGQATWNITEQLSVTGGLRYTNESKSSDTDPASSDTFATVPLAGPLAPFAPLAGFQVFPPGTPYTAAFDDDVVTGTANLSYEISDDASAYLRYARGYKSGGINLSQTAGGQTATNPVSDPSLAVFEPETVDSYEAGLKGQFFDNRLVLNVAAFYQELENFQANSFDGIFFTIRNAAEVEGIGMEFEYIFRPTERLTFSGGLTLQDITYGSFTTAEPTLEQAQAGAITQDLTGRSLNFANDVTVTGTIEYVQPVGNDLELVFRSDYRFRDDYLIGQNLDPNTRQGDSFVLNASITLLSDANGWDIAVWGKNITDEEIFNVIFDSPLQPGSFNTFVNDPPTYGASLSYRF
ncbi:TonB-dependent receptor [uncultured Erythrobacter sp.]|uniref:TonB-dependent receptor n=1 Tax=uncultured Erythrobacter sp. TaxID=263913 RepID=UPI002632CEAD|nr:TonB-dependent receptor [uncultured Erythrobacter sp.]